METRQRLCWMLMLIPETISNMLQSPVKGQPLVFHYNNNFSWEKLNVWNGLCENRNLVGSYFFERNLNGWSYLEKLNHFVIPQLSLTYFFILNVCGGHRMVPRLNAMIMFKNVYMKYSMIEYLLWITQRRRWQDHHITPRDFSLWGYLKKRVFTSLSKASKFCDKA